MDELRFASRVQNMAGNVIRELLKLTQQPDIISFAGGMPAPEAFPAEQVAELAAEVVRTKRDAVLQYGVTEGYYPLREWIAGWVAEKGIRAKAEDVLIISGAQQGIDLAAKAMLNPHDKVAVESPTYLAAIQIFKTYEASFVVAEGDMAGLDVDRLENLIVAEKPKLIYLVPTFQNPTGRTLPLQRRKAVADLLSRHEVVLIEDDPYANLRYSGEALPAIMSFDQSEQTVYLGSFSKLISPGMRVGFAIARGGLFRKLVIGKQGTDVHTSNLSQVIIHEFCSRGYLDAHLQKICRIYDEKRVRMQEMVAKYMPENITWTSPEGGLFLWGELPAGVDSKRLLEAAVKERVAFIPGESFYVQPIGENTMRLNFSNAKLEDIEIGIARLAGVLRQFMPA